MKKILFASSLVLASAIGFFLGALYVSPDCPFKPQNNQESFAMKDIPKDAHPKKFHHKGEKPKDFHKNKKLFLQKMDSILNVNGEQKAALEELRKSQDSLFALTRKKTKEAEKALREALEAKVQDSLLISEKKAALLKIQEEAIHLRISGNYRLTEILTPEQREKMLEYRKEFKKKHFKKHQFKNGNPPSEEFSKEKTPEVH